MLRLEHALFLESQDRAIRLRWGLVLLSVLLHIDYYDVVVTLAITFLVIRNLRT